MPRQTSLHYDDFVIEVSQSGVDGYTVTARSRSDTCSCRVPENLDARLDELRRHADKQADFWRAAGGRYRGSGRAWSPLAWLCRLFSSRSRSREETGRKLFEFICPDGLSEFLNDAQAVSFANARGVRIRLIMSDFLPPTLPWEQLYQDGARLVMKSRTAVVRDVHSAYQHETPDLPQPLRVLVIASTPDDTDEIDARSEFQHLRTALGELEARGDVIVQYVLDATIDEISDVQMLDDIGVWHVVHIISHGRFVGGNGGPGIAEMAFRGDDGNSVWIGADALAGQVCANAPARLVVLNCCESALGDDRGALSAADHFIRNGTDAVIAMRHMIPDHLAVKITRALYGSLANGKSLEESVRQARYVCDGSPYWETPALCVRRASSKHFQFKMSVEADVASAAAVVESAHSLENLSDQQIRSLIVEADFASRTAEDNDEVNAAISAIRGRHRFIHQNYRGAAAYFREAVTLSPLSEQYWKQLLWSHINDGDMLLSGSTLAEMRLLGFDDEEAAAQIARLKGSPIA